MKEGWKQCVPQSNIVKTSTVLHWRILLHREFWMYRQRSITSTNTRFWCYIFFSQNRNVEIRWKKLIYCLPEIRQWYRSLKLDSHYIRGLLQDVVRGIEGNQRLVPHHTINAQITWKHLIRRSGSLGSRVTRYYVTSLLLHHSNQRATEKQY